MPQTVDARFEDRPALSEPLGQILARTVADPAPGQGASTLEAMPTGLETLDAELGGLWPGHLTLLAGSTRSGTSTAALTIARATAVRHGRPVLLVTPETAAPDVALRLLAAECLVPLGHLRQGPMADFDWDRVRARHGSLAGAPLYVHDDGSATVGDVIMAAVELAGRGLRLVVVDDLQAVVPATQRRNRSRELEETAVALKRLARELSVAVVLVSKLGRPLRAPDADAEPNLADLGAAAGVADVADEVILLHRGDLASGESLRPGEVDLWVLKNRQGPIPRTVVVALQSHYARLVDMVH